MMARRGMGRRFSPAPASQPAIGTYRPTELTAFSISAPIRDSSAGVSFFSANAVGRISPSSTGAVSLNPSVPYLALNFCALWKKQTGRRGVHRRASPYQVLGDRAGAAVFIAVVFMMA